MSQSQQSQQASKKPKKTRRKQVSKSTAKRSKKTAVQARTHARAQALAPHGVLQPLEFTLGDNLQNLGFNEITSLKAKVTNASIHSLRHPHLPKLLTEKSENTKLTEQINQLTEIIKDMETNIRALEDENFQLIVLYILSHCS